MPTTASQDTPDGPPEGDPLDLATAQAALVYLLGSVPVRSLGTRTVQHVYATLGIGAAHALAAWVRSVPEARTSHGPVAIGLERAEKVERDRLAREAIPPKEQP
jgi:hypothetical protein